MVCKRDVLSWFKELNIFKRLDFVCALMDCCNPIELRFLGTYVEDLCRRDYDRLREFQINASNVQYLSKLTDVNDIRTLDKMLTSLALMDSTFKEGAEVIFDILKQHTDSILYSYQTSVSIERVMLLAVMAVNHPAFEFSQKQELRTQLSVLLKAVEVNSPCNQSDNTTVGEAVEEIDCNEDLSGQASIDRVRSNKVFVQNIKVNGFNRSHENRYEYTFQITWSDNSVTSVSKTHVQLFEFQCKLLNLFPEQAGEHKSMMPYLEGKRISSTAHKGELAEKTLPDIEEYVRQLSNLPPHILQCHHVVAFFCPSSLPTTTPVIPNVNAEQNVVLDPLSTNCDDYQVVYCEQPCDTDLNEQAESLQSNEQPEVFYATDATQMACHKEAEGTVNLAEGYHVPSEACHIPTEACHMPAEACRIPTEAGQIPTEACQLPTSSDNSTKMVYSITVTSPMVHTTNVHANIQHVQSIYPQVTLDNQRQHNRAEGVATSPRGNTKMLPPRPTNAWPAYNQAISSHVMYNAQLQVMPYSTTVASDMVAPVIQEWLKKQRLHKYNTLFQGMTVEQVLKLSEQQIDSWDIVTGAKGRIKTQLEQLRKNGFSELNGLSQSMPPYYQVGGGGGGPNRIYYSPVHPAMEYPQLLMHQTCEPTSSDASSSSSDENERDSEGSEHSVQETSLACSVSIVSTTNDITTGHAPEHNIGTLQTPDLTTTNVSPGASPQLSPIQHTLNAPVNDENVLKMNMVSPDSNSGQTFSKLTECKKPMDCAQGKLVNNKIPVYSNNMEYRLNPASLVIEDTRYPCYTEGLNRGPPVGCVTNSGHVNRVDITFGNVPISLASPCGRTSDMQQQMVSGAVGSNMPMENTPYCVARTMYSSLSSQNAYPTSSQHQNRASSETYIAPTTVTFSTTTAPVLALGNNSTYSNESTLGVTYNNNQPTYGANSVLACTTCNSTMPCANVPPHSNLHVPYNSYVPQGAVTYQNFNNYYHQGGMIPPNSILNQGIPSSPRYSNVPPPPFQNNLPGELTAYGNGHYGLMHQHGTMYVGMGIAGHRPGPAAAHHGHLSNPGMVSTKKLTCYNCGLQGHRASECREQGMQSLTQQSQYNMNFKPVDQCDTTTS
ncbi:uncharacterized protein [Antedon mediterranea]|uniref:uncharacterized protein n=1 Tax=Antedon mediterranea TaxID=105859 RepID=UPI003AF4EA88